MKYVQTFWTGNVKSGPGQGLGQKAGWVSSEYHWMSWALSCLQALKLYGQVELVTDARGKSILIDQLKLPYTSVSLALEGFEVPHPALFALSKLKTYSLQDEPFVHLDGDVFLYQPFSEDLLKAPMIASNLEVNLEYNRFALEEVTAHFEQIPAVFEGVLAQDVIYASNAGVIGGNDLDFIQSYCQQAFAFMEENKAQLQAVPTPSNLNFLFEQCFLYYLAEQEGVPITYFMPEPVDHPLYHDYARFLDIPNIPMIHTVGGFKGNTFVTDNLSKRLRLDYPEYYYRILSLCRKDGHSLRNKVYMNEFFDAAFYPEHYQTAIQKAPLSENNDVEEQRAYHPEALTRTLRMLKYLDSPFPAAKGEVVNGNELVAHIESLKDEGAKERLVDLLQVETQLANMGNHWFTSGNITTLYAHDLQRPYHMAQAFGQGFDHLLQTRVGRDTLLCWLEPQWHWKTDDKTPLEAVIKRNLEIDPAYYGLTLIPNVLRLVVDEHYQDQLESALIDLLATPKTVASCLSEMAVLFDQGEEVVNDPQFIHLIMSALKRLILTGVLKIY